ncbi:MAG: 16S rRNA (adenine(1518)-N(6)/adenine(1519)-N(6))-dimethyltransferase RsmA, partial [Candidatus Pacebacteria bacterium]|nr:16S rRNA (adenine(1518)-N(6)/adenine(1519)-N(6))-dimethyltransferase RsmA [Candidatus Paceibacterota bacterium]
MSSIQKIQDQLKTLTEDGPLQNNRKLMSTLKEIKNQFKKNEAAPLKRLGQNFLVSQNVLNKIIETAQLKPSDTIVEIGPGLGALTFELAKKVRKVVAVEKDQKFFEILKENLEAKNVKNVLLINEDALKFQFSTVRPRAHCRGVFNFQTKNYKLIANLPYNIATAVIMKFLEAENPPELSSALPELSSALPELMVVMVQKEVAQRICAKPPHMNKLAIFCQLYAMPKIITYVPPTAFHPKPKVFSAILQLSPFQGPIFKSSRDPVLGTLIKIGFSHPRKTLLSNFIKNGKDQPFTILSKEKMIEWFKENSIDPKQRPETLTIHN